MNIRLSVLLCLGLFGCAAEPIVSQKALKVQLQRQNSGLLNQCKLLAPLTTTASGWRFAPSYAVENASIKAREQTADLGGDTVVILNMDSEADILTVQASALRCYGN